MSDFFQFMCLLLILYVLDRLDTVIKLLEAAQ